MRAQHMIANQAAALDLFVNVPARDLFEGVTIINAFDDEVLITEPPMDAGGGTGLIEVGTANGIYMFHPEEFVTVIIKG